MPMYAQAQDCLSRHTALRQWWKDVPEPAAEALIVACLAGNITGSKNILSHIRAIGGGGTAQTADRLLSRTGPYWNRHRGNRFKLSHGGMAALLNERGASGHCCKVRELL